MSQSRLPHVSSPAAGFRAVAPRAAGPLPPASTASAAGEGAPAFLAPALLGLLALAAVALLSLPAARGYSATLGWMPLWLAGLPASAWLALWLGRRGDRGAGASVAVASRRRRGPAAVMIATRRRAPAPQRAPGRRAA